MSKDKLFKKLMTANDYPYAIEVWADSVTFTKEQKKWIKSKLQNEEDAKMLDHIFQRVYVTGYQTAIETTMMWQIDYGFEYGSDKLKAIHKYWGVVDVSNKCTIAPVINFTGVFVWL